MLFERHIAAITAKAVAFSIPLFAHRKEIWTESL